MRNQGQARRRNTLLTAGFNGRNTWFNAITFVLPGWKVSALLMAGRKPLALGFKSSIHAQLCLES
jgi:hypothetical protein